VCDPALIACQIIIHALRIAAIIEELVKRAWVIREDSRRGASRTQGCDSPAECNASWLPDICTVQIEATGDLRTDEVLEIV
jgi:hypothetical protein